MLAWVADLYQAALSLKQALLGYGKESGFLQELLEVERRKADALERIAESNNVIATSLDAMVAESSEYGTYVRVYNLGH